MSMERRYGFFRCTNCGKLWESSHVYCTEGTDNALFAQDCKSCKTSSLPYKVQRIRCSLCGEEECTCTETELEEKREEKRHVDPNKPHMAELCHKCRSGNPCT